MQKIQGKDLNVLLSLRIGKWILNVSKKIIFKIHCSVLAIVQHKNNGIPILGLKNMYMLNLII